MALKNSKQLEFFNVKYAVVSLAAFQSTTDLV